MLSCGPVGTNLKLKCEGTKVSSAGGVLNCYMNPRPIFVKEGVSCPWPWVMFHPLSTVYDFFSS